WSLADGMSDLGNLLSPPGLAANGWSSLDSLSAALPDASLLGGSGIHLPPDIGARGFLLAPSVPEPFSFGALAVLCLLSRRRIDGAQKKTPRLSTRRLKSPIFRDNQCI